MERYDALTVRESNGKSYFTKLGAMFPNRNSDGFTLVLDGVPASVDGQYRLILKPAKERDGQARGGGGNSFANSPADDLDDDGIPFMRSDSIW